MRPIDHAKRCELCRRILAGDATALASLCDLYRAAGLVRFAEMIGATDGKVHARSVLLP